MSLNGLDDARVKEAYETAVAEPGGWFLLKYASRDEVELLGRGNGGIVEVRNNIAQYEDKSPLYGFLRYRRRSVLIRYLPDGCSRLIQARVTVHFDAICDRFSPHDTTFSISDAKELKDTKLSAACSLHAASGSTSSSTSSLRRRRLMEIAEEEEEEERERKRQSLVKEGERPITSATLSGPPVRLDADLAKVPEASRFANELEPPNFTGVPRPSSPAKSFDESSRRMSSQSSRTNELYPTSSYPYSKPRVKLGPRPSADTGRPGSSGGSAARVATVPAGLKSMSKGPRKARSHSQGQDDGAPGSPNQGQGENAFPSIDVTGADGSLSQKELPQVPAASAATEALMEAISAQKANMQAPTSPSGKQNAISPEKARLLKAMKLREKKKLKNLQPTLNAPDTDIPSAPSTPGLPEDVQESEVTAESEAVATAETPLELEPRTEDAEQPDDDLVAMKSDSGIDVATDQASVNTVDSHPTTPGATSEIGESTQASSLSDSTDETVLAKEDQEDDPVDEPEPRETAETTGDKPEIVPSDITPVEDQPDEKKENPQDRQSQATIIAPKEEPVAEPEENIAAPEEPALVPEEPVSASEAAVEEPAVDKEVPTTDAETTPTQASPPEQATNDVLPSETVPESGPDPTIQKPTESDAELPAIEQAPAAQIRIPVSKFSTQEAKPTSAAVGPNSPPTISQAPEVGSQDVEPVPPPVPEKDDVVPQLSSAETENVDGRGRKLPDPIQTDFDSPDNDKRRSMISILENDGLMDELQSATVQEATPVAVSKSPLSPFFGLDQPSKQRPVSVLEDTGAQRFARTVSNPVRNSFLSPSEMPSGQARSTSAGTAHQQRGFQQQTPTEARPKSAKLGSSISQRIKALEKFSGNPPGTEPVTTPKDRPASTFFAVRKTSIREPSRPSSVVDRDSSVTRVASPSPPASRDSTSAEATRTMGRGRSGSLVNRLSMFEGGMPPRGRPDSVQVTARIVRDPSKPFSKGLEPSGGNSTEYGTLDLKQSPLVVDVQNRMDSRSPVRPPSSNSVRTLERDIAEQAKQSVIERRQSKRSRDGEGDSPTEATEGRRPRRRSSLSVVKDFIKDRTGSVIGGKSGSSDSLGSAGVTSPGTSRPPSRAPSVQPSGSLVRRLSVSSRRSSIERNHTPLSSVSLATSRATDISFDFDADAKNGSGSSEKRFGAGSSDPVSPKSGNGTGSRASRFMRRISNTLATGRKTGAPSISPTVAEENAAEVEAASKGNSAISSAAAQSPPSIVAFMGDVNVQFPDNLLWKRRSICLDSTGFLILSGVQGAAMMPAAVPGKDRHGALIKRYHMSDFKAPYAPDVELQELPNSVVLDLVEGSAVQIACEDRAGQMSILRILEEAHRNHSNF
ncbi:hypothetical protein B0J18DRAFT_185511 [Chaetomium sp. MPI-SDFR-AT-0129]|nr:hypothetical protein B0J18DRAFT_185511 [Chaetomium sp. MPI-SDFR-AT-0129]